jgi:flagellar motor switch/type III secretory pathway protein FliN
MKTLRFLTVTACMAVLVLATSCGSTSRLGRKGTVIQKPAQAASKAGKTNTATPVAEAKADGKPDLRDSIQMMSFLQQVNDHAQHARFITSKVKFSLELGNQNMTLTGNLKMKRDDVIRLQLMAFGFVEAGRLELTPDYVLIIDRINKQYLKVPYSHLDFLRNSNIDFYVLQALFWNELFQPGKSHLTDGNLKSYNTEVGFDDDVVVAIEDGKLSYRWLADHNSAQVKMANIMYNDRYRGNYQLNWDYVDFKKNDSKLFPMTHKVAFTTPQKEIKFEMMLNSIGNEDNWETRTTLSGKYRQVEIEDILRRFMAL